MAGVVKRERREVGETGSLSLMEHGCADPTIERGIERGRGRRGRKWRREEEESGNEVGERGGHQAASSGNRDYEAARGGGPQCGGSP